MSLAFRHRPSVLAALVVAALLAGCDTPRTPTDGSPLGAAPGATAAPSMVTEAPLQPISTQDEARYTDVVATADGKLHVIVQDKDTQSGRPQVYYRASSDGGATWSQAVNLLENDLTSQAGFVRLVADGQGRVYAFWKTYAGFDVVDPSGGNAGTLTYRVLDGGEWRAATPVGTAGQVVGWVPLVGPDGALRVVWSEPPKGPDGRYRPDWQAGLVRSAIVAGDAVGGANDVYSAPALVQTPEVLHYDGYKGFSGYVDASGGLHLAALKTTAQADGNGPTTPDSIATWDGHAWKTLFPTGRFEALSRKLTTTPPVLWRDGAGAEHLLLLNQALDQAALQDYRTDRLDAPTTVYALKNVKGGIGGFQASVGPSGRLAAFLEAHDAADVILPDDFLVLRFDGTTWQPPVNVTSNQARATLADTQLTRQTEVSKLVTYSARFGAGAFDAQGRLATAFVNTEIVTVMEKVEAWRGTSGFVGTNSSTHAYFQKI
jgi:hypothetical protein